MFYNQYRISVLFGIDGVKMLQADIRHKENQILFAVVDRRYPSVATHRDMYYMTQCLAQKMQEGTVEDLVPFNAIVENSCKAMAKHYLAKCLVSPTKELIEEIRKEIEDARNDKEL